MSVVSVVCCQVEVSATDLITRPEESYRLWRASSCVIKTPRKNEEAKARYRAVKIQP
jgi:hypothetical protein